MACGQSGPRVAWRGTSNASAQAAVPVVDFNGQPLRSGVVRSVCVRGGLGVALEGSDRSPLHPKLHRVTLTAGSHSRPLNEWTRDQSRQERAVTACLILPLIRAARSSFNPSRSCAEYHVPPSVTSLACVVRPARALSSIWAPLPLAPGGHCRSVQTAGTSSLYSRWQLMHVSIS